MKTATLFDIKGQVAAVTGGAAGIGRAYAEAMAANGADVVVMDKDREQMVHAVQQLRRTGQRVEGLVVDVARREDIRAAFVRAIELFGRLDIVFANAGISAG